MSIDYSHPISQGFTFNEASALGKIPGNKTFTITGRVDNAGTIGVRKDSRPGAINLVYLDSAERLNVSSDDLNDTAAGTGAQQVLVIGLDNNYLEQRELIELDGLTPVLSVNAYLRVNLVGVSRVGTVEQNIGTITLDAEIAGTQQSSIPPTLNKSVQSNYTVPADKTLLLTGIYLSVGKNDDFEANTAVRDATVSKAFIRVSAAFLYESFGTLTGLNSKIESKSDVKFEIIPLTPNARIVSTMFVIEISN